MKRLSCHSWNYDRNQGPIGCTKGIKDCELCKDYSHRGCISTREIGLRHTCNWLVDDKCARNLECEGHCEEYVKHQSHMTRGVSPLEAAYQKALQEGLECINRPIGERIPAPSKRKDKEQKGEKICPVCGNDSKAGITKLRIDWWYCRKCGWEGHGEEKLKKIDIEE